MRGEKQLNGDSLILYYSCLFHEKKLGFVKRIVERFLDEKVKERCYFALVRPHLEYAASVWDPVQKDLIRELNEIQRKAARIIKNCYGRTDSVTQMLSVLGWEPLETRRLRARLRSLEQLRMDILKSDTENIISEPRYIYPGPIEAIN